MRRIGPLRARLSPDHIAIVIDAIRPQIYSPGGSATASGSYFAAMRTYLIQHARPAGFEVIDLDPVFTREHSQTGERFEFATDSHWNARAHEVVAREISKSRVFREVFGMNPGVAEYKHICSAVTSKEQ